MKKNATRQALQDALVALSAEKSYEKISVAQIADRAHINRQTFYYHYKSKNDLLKEICYEDSLHYLDQDISLDNWEEQMLLMLKVMYNKSDFYQNILFTPQDILLTEFIRLIEERFLHLFHLLDEDHALEPEDRNFYAGFFAYGCAGVLKRWLQTGLKESPIEIAARQFRLAKDVEFFSMRLYDGYDN